MENQKVEAEEAQQVQTFGMKAVGYSFNPSSMPEVDRCKMQHANCIDQMHALRNSETSSPEQKRLASIAITEMQGAQMWAVKALTWKD